jgi:hypothetical protein
VIKNQLERAEHAQAILQLIAMGDLQITHVWSKQVGPAKDHERWLVDVRVTGERRLTFAVEGNTIASLVGCVDTDGRQLIDSRHPMAVIDWLQPEEQNALDEAVMSAHAHVVPMQ